MGRLHLMAFAVGQGGKSSCHCVIILANPYLDICHVCICIFLYLYLAGWSKQAGQRECVSAFIRQCGQMLSLAQGASEDSQVTTTYRAQRQSANYYSQIQIHNTQYKYTNTNKDTNTNMPCNRTLFSFSICLTIFPIRDHNFKINSTSNDHQSHHHHDGFVEHSTSGGQTIKIRGLLDNLYLPSDSPSHQNPSPFPFVCPASICICVVIVFVSN